MSGWFSFDVRCAGCGFTQEMLTKRDEADGAWECPECGGECRRTIGVTAPALMTRAAFPMGTKREGFADMREALDLETASYNLPPNKRGAIQKEIHKLKSIKK